mmetsp:Transcript_74115/g.131158  ORF Transcript_74115/g.131158 Transcript_74115/m.131158 type:complete len:554 (+) Transcript_74115:92-1753(+)
MAQRFSLWCIVLISLLAKSVCHALGEAIEAKNPSASFLKQHEISAPSGAKRRLSSASTLSTFAVNFASFIVDSPPITMLGTDFTPNNYQVHMLDFFQAGVANDNGKAMTEWYLTGTGETEVRPGVVRQGPGPNTTTHLAFKDVENLLSQYPNKIESGILERGNELGMQILGDGAWPEVPGGIKSIALGQTRENHAFVRPYLANVLDNGGWTDGWLRQQADAFFLNRDEFHSSDVNWWVAQLLHKIHLDLDLTDSEAKEFADYMSSIILLIPFPEATLNSFLVNTALSVGGTLAKKAEYLESLKSAIKAKYINEEFVRNGDDEKINLLASVMLDSLQFAGGISVPTVINYVIALTHMANENRHDALKQIMLSADNYEWILWETLRRYAPVAGVPSWEKQGDGFKHVIPNLATALRDSSIFDNPLDFKQRSQEQRDLVQSTGMPWAGPAVQNYSAGSPDTSAPHSHNCPAQDLSLRIMKSFLAAFVAKGGSSGWVAVDSGSITITGYRSSAVSLLRRGVTRQTGCAYFPSCPDGFSWESTAWCGWGQRDWTCKVL